MIYTLLIDTTTRFCSVALAKNEIMFVQKNIDDARAHVRVLAPMVQELLEDVCIQAVDLKKIIVCTGPGSFTGLRVGMSFAKAFAYALNIPCLGVSLFDALSCQIHAPRYIVTIDTKCGDFYGGIYHENDVDTYGILTLEDIMMYKEKEFQIFSDKMLEGVSAIPDVPLGMIKMMADAQENPSPYYMRTPHVSV